MVWQIELKRPAKLQNDTLQIKFAFFQQVFTLLMFHCDSYLRSGKSYKFSVSVYEDEKKRTGLYIASSTVYFQFL